MPIGKSVECGCQISLDYESHVLSHATPKAGILSGGRSTRVFFDLSYTAPAGESLSRDASQGVSFSEKPPVPRSAFPKQQKQLRTIDCGHNSGSWILFSPPAHRALQRPSLMTPPAECPAGSPPSCFCGNDGLSQEWSDQISTNVLNNCLTSSQAQAASAASVFAAYCSVGEGTAVASTTTDEGSTSTTAAKETKSTTAAQIQVARMAGASLTTSSQTSIGLSSTATATPSDTETASSGGFDTSDKIAIGIGLPVGVATILGAWFAWKMYQRAKEKDKKNTLRPSYGGPPSMELGWMGPPQPRDYPTEFIPPDPSYPPSVSGTSVSGTTRESSLEV